MEMSTRCSKKRWGDVKKSLCLSPACMGISVFAKTFSSRRTFGPAEFQCSRTGYIFEGPDTYTSDDLCILSIKQYCPLKVHYICNHSWPNQDRYIVLHSVFQTYFSFRNTTKFYQFRKAQHLTGHSVLLHWSICWTGGILEGHCHCPACFRKDWIFSQNLD